MKLQENQLKRLSLPCGRQNKYNVKEK